jgi:hypothetical protein
MDKGRTNRPDFIIIGAMKCATSALHDQLKAHHTFFMTTPKEPNFFSDDSVYAQGISWYQSLYDEARTDQIRGESSTHYTKLPNHQKTLPRLKAFCPQIKCIYMMRHPMDRLVSHYIHEWSQRVISCDINTAVDQFPELIDYGRYSMQLEPYRATFGSGAILPVFSENFRHDPLRELQKIFNFLGVKQQPSYHQEIRSNVSAERLRTCSWRDAMINNQILRVLRRTIVPKSVRNSIKGLWTMKERPVLSSVARQRIEKIYNDDLEVLGTWFDIKLDCDNFKSQVLNLDEVQWIA